MAFLKEKIKGIFKKIFLNLDWKGPLMLLDLKVQILLIYSGVQFHLRENLVQKLIFSLVVI